MNIGISLEDKSNILIVHSNTDGLQYDINAQLKSFFPDKDVRVLLVDEAGNVLERVHDESIFELPVFMDVILDENHGTVCLFPDVKVTYDTITDFGAKNTFKLKLYDILSDYTGRTMPWGNMTGVRPSKVAMNRMDEGMNDDEVRDFLKNHHRVSPDKIELAIGIAHREKKIMEGLNLSDGYSLYIGIPFCPTTCLYCSFTSYPICSWEKRVDEYLEALAKELEWVASGEMPGSSAPDTIYIGGGTPTSLSEGHLEKLLKLITSTINMDRCLELTCEAGRPDSITRGKLEIMKKYGVTRISVNPQTMQQKTLDLIGRRTTVEQVVSAYNMAREIGFDNINMDIILGLPGEDESDVADTFRQIEALGPDSLTVHSLAIKRASALKKRLDEIGIDALKNTDVTMHLSSECATNLGMSPYYMYRQKNMSGNFENTGYSVPEKECIYNVAIMEEVQTIVACGAGTVTKRVYGDGRIERCDNVKDVGLYIEKIDEMIERKRRLFEDEK